MLRFIVNTIGTALVLFNTYAQFKAKKEDRNVRRLYPIYFKVMCIFLVFDNLLSFFLRLIPFYQMIKLFLMIWLSIPKCSGAVFVYRFYVNGFMKTYEDDLDNLIEKSKLTFRQTLNKYYEMAYGKYNERRNAAKSFIQSKTKKTEEIGDELLNKDNKEKDEVQDENEKNQISSNIGISKRSENILEVNDEDDSTMSILGEN
jgi:receptor expression-enhancing protein 1/2/3/4